MSWISVIDREPELTPSRNNPDYWPRTSRELLVVSADTIILAWLAESPSGTRHWMASMAGQRPIEVINVTHWMKKPDLPDEIFARHRNVSRNDSPK